MNYFLKIYVFITVVIAAVSVASSSTACSNSLYKINNLQVDSSKYIIDRLNPKFSWGSELVANSKTQTTFKQEKFIISIVDDATSKMVWQSGVIRSSKPVYRAPTLPIQHFRKYTWFVKSFDSRGCWITSEKSNLYVSNNSIFESAKWIGSHENNQYRGEFKIDTSKKISSAHIHVCGLSFSYVSVNGNLLTSIHLTSAPWTNNERSNGYSTVDITKYLGNQETQAVGITLGYGWRNRTMFVVKDTEDPGLKQDTIDRVLIMSLAVVYEGENKTSIVLQSGDGRFEASKGPVIYDSVYNGETFDSRLADDGWDTINFDKTTSKVSWEKASVVPGPTGVLFPWIHTPIQITRTVKPVQITKPYDGVYVVDFGANLAGVTQLINIDCKQDSNVTLIHAEIMQHAGLPGLPNPDPKLVYTANLRSAKATDVYICNGSPENSYMPRLTYHGFRFVEVHVGDSGVKITNDNIEMLHFHSAVVQKASINFQSDTLNRIQKMAVGAQRSNLMSVPTDCDQRDERLGWMGDANLSGESMMLNFDMPGFFRHFINIMTSEQDEDGSLPDVVPFVRFGGRPADVSWSGVYINWFYQLWKHDDDLDTAKEHLDDMLSQLDNVKMQAKAGLNKMHTPYGDWCPPPIKMGTGQGPKPSSPYTSAFSYLAMIGQVQEIALALGNKTVSSKLSTMFNEVAKEFNNVFYSTKNETVYDNGLQTALVLPMALNIVPDMDRAKDALLASIKKMNGHYNCGIVGFRWLFDVLSNINEHDMALNLLSNTDYPSIGYYFANGEEAATENLWELPDANREGVGMNSRNHHMWSSYSSYLVRKVAGISQHRASSGHWDLELRPGYFKDLSYASSTLKLKQGDVVLNWEKIGGTHCDRAAKGDVVHLDCGENGGVISEVTFASYGFLKGTTCSSMKVTSCQDPNTHKKVTEMCLGKNRCDVKSSSDIICNGDVDQVEQLVVKVKCSSKAKLHVKTVVPLGSKARLYYQESSSASSNLKKVEKFVDLLESGSYEHVFEY